jgi:hypothetical protein
MKINGEDGLFAYINYGLLLLLIPIIIYLIIFAITKKYK